MALIQDSLPRSVARIAPTPMQAAAGGCFAYTLFAALLYPQTFMAVLGAYPVLRYYVAIPIFLGIGLFAAAFFHQPRRPLTFIWNKLKDRGLGALAIFGMLVLSASAFTTLKHEYAYVVSFFADAPLAAADRSLHFGDPWVYARAIMPAWADFPLYLLYSICWFAYVVAIVVYAAFVANGAHRARFFISFALTAVLLGTLVRLAGSSAGPIFYERLYGDGTFAALDAAMRSAPGSQKVLMISDYLFQSYTTQRTVLGTGISAMPSFHVALTFLAALFVGSRSRAGGIVAWSYFVIILFGSVYFGWHYALDGYVSMACVYLVWRLAARLSVPAA